jgi:hypothetical protein
VLRREGLRLLGLTCCWRWATVLSAAPTAGVGFTGRWARPSVAHRTVRVKRVEANDATATGSVADGAAHDHGGDDEQGDLEEHQETRRSSQGPHIQKLS